MVRFGIRAQDAYGIPIPILRRLAKETGINHALAIELWQSGIHEGRILATMIDDSNAVTQKQMEKRISEFDSWDVCDQCCINLFVKSKFAFAKAREWTARESEFEKRAGFALIAALAVHRKDVKDSVFEKLLPLIKENADDDRNFVKKAVNWALRQIGKRSAGLNRKAITIAEEIARRKTKSARWIAADAIRELTSAPVQRKLSHMPSFE